MQKVSTKHFYSVERNGKTCSILMYQGGTYPQILIFFSGSLTLQIALNISKKKESHSQQKLKSVKEIENESKLKVVFLKQRRNPHMLHSNHGKMEQISCRESPGTGGEHPGDQLSAEQ